MLKKLKDLIVRLVRMTKETPAIHNITKADEKHLFVWLDRRIAMLESMVKSMESSDPLLKEKQRILQQINYVQTKESTTSKDTTSNTI